MDQMQIPVNLRLTNSLIRTQVSNKTNIKGLVANTCTLCTQDTHLVLVYENYQLTEFFGDEFFTIPIANTNEFGDIAIGVQFPIEIIDCYDEEIVC